MASSDGKSCDDVSLLCSPANLPLDPFLPLDLRVCHCREVPVLPIRCCPHTSCPAASGGGLVTKPWQRPAEARTVTLMQCETSLRQRGGRVEGNEDTGKQKRKRNWAVSLSPFNRHLLHNTCVSAVLYSSHWVFQPPACTGWDMALGQYVRLLCFRS